MRLQVVKPTHCCDTIQCSRCFRMSKPTIADLDARAGTYYCVPCAQALPELTPHMRDNLTVSLMLHERERA